MAFSGLQNLSFNLAIGIGEDAIAKYVLLD
jgi:hypothetical protein